MSRPGVNKGGRCRRNGNARSRIACSWFEIGTQRKQAKREKGADRYEIPEQRHGTALRCDAPPAGDSLINTTLRRSGKEARVGAPSAVFSGRRRPGTNVRTSAW